MPANVKDVKWGLKWGAGFSVFMTLYTLGLYVVLGSEPFDRVGVTPYAAGLMYVVASLSAGLIVGLLRPLAGSRDGAMFVGTIAALPASVVMHASFFGWLADWSTGDWLQCVFMAVLFGAGLGYLWHGRGFG